MSEMVDDGVALYSMAHPVGKKVGRKGLRKSSLETMEIEIPEDDKLVERVLKVRSGIGGKIDDE